MAILIKSKTVAKNPVAKTVKAPAKNVKAPVAKTVKAPAKKAQSVREPVAKKFFLSKEVCALWAMKGLDLIPCYWKVKSCHAASEVGETLVSMADKLASVKMTAKTGLFLVGVGPKGARCVAVKSAHGQQYERMRDGVTRVRGDASVTGSFVGERKACEAWLKTKAKRGLEDFWRSSDGSKETARSAGFTCF